MNKDDTIKVGDRVEHKGYGQRLVVAIDGDQAWIREGNFDVIARTKNLTRIEPEKAAVHPQYAVGDRVYHDGICHYFCEYLRVTEVHPPEYEYVVTTPRGGVIYTVRESALLPIPEPCDRCGK